MTSATLPLEALGVGVDVVCVGDRAAEAHAALAARWSLCARTDGSATTTVEVDLGARADPGAVHRVAAPDLDVLLVEATQAVTHAAIEAGIGRLLMFHAAGIAHPTTGATAVLVAAGGTGKTTACRTLAPGRAYVSDETVGIAADGRIRPYPKPLSVRRAGTEVKDELDPVALGLAPPGVTPYVEAVLLLDRDPDGPDRPDVQPLDPFVAITDVVPETSSLEALPRPLHRLHDLLGSASLLARVRYREAERLEPLLRELIGPATHDGGPR